MTDAASTAVSVAPGTLPGAAVPYVLRAGQGLRHLAAGQVIHTLAGTHETNGGFGAMLCDATIDRMPIPMHWHEKEHDTWLCTRGKVQVWCGDQSRILSPGDFAYVKPGDTHSYQSVAPRMQFFGIVAPGGWEGFFADAGEVWGMTALPPADRPFDFARMGPAMGKYGIMRVENPVFVQPTPIGDADRELPDQNSSYFLEAGYGRRRISLGHLSTAVLTGDQSVEVADIRVIEGGEGAAMPALRHAATTLFLYVLAGEIALTLEGEEHRLAGGDSANIPVGCSYATHILSGTARWIAASAGGNGAVLWDEAGLETPAFHFPAEGDREADLARLAALSGIDAALV